MDIATTAPEQPFVRSLPALLTLALAVAIGFTLNGSFGTVQEAAKAELALSDYRLSLLQGVAAAVPMIFLSVPIGIAVDRTSRTRILLLLAVVWTAGTLLTAMAGNFALLFVARMMTAIGMTGSLTAALSLAADMCAPAQRGRATLIVTLGKIVGQASGFALTGGLFAIGVGGGMPAWLDGVLPWRAAHYVLGIVAALLIPPMLLLREPSRRETEVGTHAPFAVVSRRLWASRSFLGPLFLGQVSIVMADAAAVIWAAPVLSRTYGLQPGDFAGWMGMLILASGIVGSVLGAAAADIGQKNGAPGGLLRGAVIAAAIGIPAALFPIAPNVTGFAVALGALMLSGTVTGLVMSVALTVYLPNELRGLCIGAFIALAGLIGFGVSPTLVAAVSDLLGGEKQLGTALAMVGVTVSIVGLFGFWQAMRHAPIR
jgi:MFS family permease